MFSLISFYLVIFIFLKSATSMGHRVTALEESKRELEPESFAVTNAINDNGPGVFCSSEGFSLVTDSSICCSEVRTYYMTKLTGRYLSYPVKDSSGRMYCYYVGQDWEISDSCSTYRYFTVCGGDSSGITFSANGVPSGGNINSYHCSTIKRWDAQATNPYNDCVSETPTPKPTDLPEPTPSPINPPTPSIYIPGANGLECKSSGFSLVTDSNICCSGVSNYIISYPVKDYAGKIYCFADGIDWNSGEHCNSGYFTVCGGDASGIEFSGNGIPNGGTIHTDQTKCFSTSTRDGPLVNPTLPCVVDSTPEPTPNNDDEEEKEFPVLGVVLGSLGGLILIALIIFFIVKKKNNDREKKKKEEEKRKQEAENRNKGGGDILLFNVLPSQNDNGDINRPMYSNTNNPESAQRNLYREEPLYAEPASAPPPPFQQENGTNSSVVNL